MTGNAPTLLLALLLAAACSIAHPAPAQAWGSDDDGTDLDDGYYLHGEWHEPEDDDRDRRLFRKEKRLQHKEAH